MPIGKRAAAEFFGTFWLVFAGCGSAVLAAGIPNVGGSEELVALNCARIGCKRGTRMPRDPHGGRRLQKARVWCAPSAVKARRPSTSGKAKRSQRLGSSPRAVTPA